MLDPHARGSDVARPFRKGTWVRVRRVLGRQVTQTCVMTATLGTPYRMPVLPTPAEHALPMPVMPLTQFLADMGTRCSDGPCAPCSL
jgi:hypothetical protein